jgi:hypothetical protein
MIFSSLSRKIISLLALAAALALTACGSSTSHSPAPSATTTTTATTSSGSGTIIPPAVAELPAAEHPQPAQFPAARGRTLQGLTAGVRPGGLLGAATGTFTPGRRRFAFALNARSGAFIYAPTAIYIARGPNRPAQGPFLAPADPLTVPPAYRSAQNTGPGGISAIYEAQLPLARTGTYTVLALTRTRQGLIGATGEIAVAASSQIPDVGQRPPAVATDTPGSVHGRLGLLTTRTPPESMHSASLPAVLGKQPIALLFSTPQFCVSRVCGPVTDIAVWLQTRYGRRITFLHQEVYVMNQPSNGLRPPFKAFGLQTEPWLFTIDRHGRIAARLEGSFGVNAFTDALKAALR